MTRLALFAALLTGVLSAGSSRADVEVAPPPRPAGVPLAPPPPVAKAENPAETVGKIIKNAKDVTERLAKSDTSTTTRKTQDETLVLIDSLINRQDDPPPKSDDNKDKKDKDDNKDKKDDKDKSDGKDKKDGPQKGDGPPKDGKKGTGGKDGPDGMSEPKDGAGQKEQGKGGRRPRAEAGKEQAGKQPKQPGGETGDQKQQQVDAKAADGKTPGSGDIGKANTAPPKSSLPVEDDLAKDVWGHLPDKLRQQVTQYYKEEFMPRYADLLKQYYSSLSEKSAKPGEKK